MTTSEINLEEIIRKQREELERYEHIIHVCGSTGCVSSDSQAVLAAFEKEVNFLGLQDKVLVKQVGCMGLCAAGPVVSIKPDNLLYKTVKVEDVPQILRALVKGEAVEDLLIDTSAPFFTRQHKVTLENSGVINPEKIEDYILHDGYKALLQVITAMSPQGVIDEIKKSGLRGRGGGGFPTGNKWQIVHDAAGAVKYVICNADEGDPGAFMDRSIIESDPHAVLEGMAIAAYAVGASRGYVYVRAEYPLAVKRLRTAIRQAERAGFLGENIHNSGFSFTVEIRLGAGAFVCGEETALISSIEGERGMPRPRPPYPAVSGLDGKPTLINNVETYANVPAIIRKGGEWFASIGTEKSKGTKVFALTGKIANTGLVEVPMGITLREIIFDIGGGVPGGHRFKAVQTGGPSGGCIPEELLDTPVDYENLTRLGSIMGSGGMIVIDDTSDIVSVARYFMEFSMDESCGKCVPCRIGTVKIYNILNKFLEGTATEADLEQLEALCEMMQTTSLCGLGKSAPNPVLSSLKYFRHEYLNKIRRSQQPEEVNAAARAAIGD
ncbi:NADH-quinone oxidoreductase subunit NuoF [Bellilinea sp.]|uniref:NADH-quinone oxidoreductase subunit NuoF n=1 Tax=Bellilinea sp. TaxID=2838785 RepID=UPI002ADE738D|nr:NADH-quinone oxidoreductase subunit NuoF [Bellilinea sp.]